MKTIREYNFNCILHCSALVVIMPSGDLSNMHLRQHWKSHINVGVSSANNNPHPSSIDWPWWFTPTNGANDISYLLVRYVVKWDHISKFLARCPTTCISPKYIWYFFLFIKINFIEEVVVHLPHVREVWH